MSHYTLEELIDLWKREKLTAEQMIGQILQMLREQDLRLREVARRAPGDVGGDAADAGGRPRQR